MTRSRPGRQRSRGAIDELPSGGLRVRVYGGTVTTMIRAGLRRAPSGAVRT